MRKRAGLDDDARRCLTFMTRRHARVARGAAGRSGDRAVLIAVAPADISTIRSPPGIAPGTASPTAGASSST